MDTQDPNLTWWNERAPLHPGTPLYQRHLAGLRSGAGSLHQTERALLPDLQGLDLLHLQCHIGTDTLSLAQMGAQVTGVDFSEAALTVARQLSQDLDLPADFVQSRVDGPTLPVAADHFDVVFTSYGTLPWFRDLDAWARNVARALKPGGQLIYVDAHPMAWVFDDTRTTLPPVPHYRYFAHTEPLSFDDSGSYADPTLATRHNRTQEWSHPVSEIVGALLGAGLQLNHMGEYPHCPYPPIPVCEQGPDGEYRLPEAHREQIPLLLSLVARKP